MAYEKNNLAICHMVKNKWNRASFSGASVCIFLKLNFIYSFIYLFGLKFKGIEFVQSVPSVCDM